MGKKSLVNTKEKEIETYLRKETLKIGGKAYKFTSPMQRHVPDRICVFPTGILLFIECKRPGGKLTGGQKAELEYLRMLGHQATTVYTKADVDLIIKAVKEEMNKRDSGQ